MPNPKRDDTPNQATTKKRKASRVGNKRFQSTLPGVARTPAFAEAEEARRSLLPGEELGDEVVPLSGPASGDTPALSDPPPASALPPTHLQPDFDDDDDAPSTYPDRPTSIPPEVAAAGLAEGDRLSGEYHISKSDDEVRRQHAERYMRRGRRALAEGDRQAAIKQFERALAKDASFDEAKAALRKARRGA